MNKYCYATLADSEEYLKEALALAISLKRVNTRYPLFIMIPTGFIKDDLIEEFKSYLPENVYIKFILPLLFDSQQNIRYNITINKLQILLFSEYDKVFFLDSDILVINNLDSYFEKPLPLMGIRETNEGKEEVDGQLFLFHPNINLFTLIIYHINLGFSDDEHLFEWFIENNFFPYPKTKIFTQKRKNDIYNKDYYHDGNFDKYFKRYSFSEIINLFNDQDIYNIIIAIKENYQLLTPLTNPYTLSKYKENFVENYWNTLIANIYKQYE